jgi:hypothetical protein
MNVRNCNRSVRAASDQKVRRLESSLISYFQLISGSNNLQGSDIFAPCAVAYDCAAKNFLRLTGLRRRVAPAAAEVS